MSVVHEAQVEVILGKMSQISPFLSFVSEVLLGSRLASTKVGVGTTQAFGPLNTLQTALKNNVSVTF